MLNGVVSPRLGAAAAGRTAPKKDAAASAVVPIKIWRLVSPTSPPPKFLSPNFFRNATYSNIDRDCGCSWTNRTARGTDVRGAHGAEPTTTAPPGHDARPLASCRNREGPIDQRDLSRFVPMLNYPVPEARRSRRAQAQRQR